MEFVINALRVVFYQIDKVVYSLIDDVYAWLLQLTRTSIFTQSEIHAFSERVYALIGIFMLFKVMISIINYVINPDDFSDKEKGFGSIIKHVILSLVMIVLVPYVFQEAYDLQAMILEENTIMNLIFGTPPDNRPSNSSYVDTAGRKIQFTLLYAFTQPNYDEFAHDDEFDLYDCKSTYETNDEGNYVFRYKPVFGSGTAESSRYIYSLNESCWGTYNPTSDVYESNGANGALFRAFKADNKELTYQNYAQGVAQQSFSLFFRKDVILASDENGRYLVDYKMGLSTAVGVATLYLFLLYCIDIAVRSIQLGFLQMIAPIPILSYCDPKSGKDGMFSKWVKKCKDVYLDLFIRLFALYFGIYIITLVGTFRDVATGEVVDNWIVIIFMIIGVLMFIKKLPDFLKDSLGFSGGTFKDFKLNPLKRIEEQAIGGKQIASVGKKATGVAAGVGVGALASGASLLTGRGVHRDAFKKAIAGGWNGEKFGKNFSNSYGAADARHKQLQEMAADGVKREDVMKEKFYNAFHPGQTRADRVTTLENQAKAIQSYYDQIKGQATACDSDDTRTFIHNGRTIMSAKTISKQLEEMKKTTISRESFAAGAAGDADYQAAIDAQRLRIKEAESDLEARINWLTQGNSTGIGSADKVIREATASINSLKDSSNSLGTSLDSSFVEITNTDVVGIMKQAKGTAAQASSGKMAEMKDVAKYAGKNNNK